MIDYSKTSVSDDYKCAKCKVKGVKLWREYQTLSPTLLCAKCASIDQQVNIEGMNSEGKYLSKLWETDQIGWYVPAVPTEEGMGYWGYTSVPEEGVKWWRRLPNR